MFAVRFSDDPAQIGLLLPAAGAVGVVLIVGVVVPAALVHPPTVTVTEYVPAAADVMFDMLGSSSDDVNPLGPVQEYVAPATVFAVRLSVCPVHTGPLFPAVGVDGIEFTTTVVVPAALVHPASVTVTEYVPAIAAVALDMVGF